jgi:hypothetical protein
MSRVRALGRFLWEFVIGDDWITAVGVAVALGVTALVAEESAAWFVMPVAVVVLLSQSVWRAARQRQ